MQVSERIVLSEYYESIWQNEKVFQSTRRKLDTFLAQYNNEIDYANTSITEAVDALVSSFCSAREKAINNIKENDSSFYESVKQTCDNGTLILNSFIDKEQSCALNSKESIHSISIKIVAKI